MAAARRRRRAAVRPDTTASAFPAFQFHSRALRFEWLEERRMLSAVSTEVDLYHISPPLFMENQGQWFDKAVMFPHQGNGANGTITDAGALRDAPQTLAMSANTLWIEDAESGLEFVIDQTDASYPLIQSQVVAEGEYAFHLAHPAPASNAFEIDQTFLIGDDTQLFFMSRLSWATTRQVAKVQLSVDGGITWPHDVYSQAGTGGQGDAGFVLRQIDLSTFANQYVRVRFLYEFGSGSWFPQTSPGIGWYVDNIQIASELQKSIYSIGDPSAYEQLFLEFVNRARADAILEAERLAAVTDPQILSVYSFFGIQPENILFQFREQVNSSFLTQHAQPLSFHPALLQAARLHTQDLFDNQFQGHTSSSNPPAPFQPGFSPTQRAAALGYIGGVGENVFSFARSVPYAHAGFAVDWGDETPTHPDYNPAFAGQGMQNPAGHRRNLHDPTYREIGIGVINGTNGTVGPQLVTQNFARGGGALITGVVYEDLNGNGFYDLGEGRPGVRVDVQGSAFYAISTQSGGYAVPASGDGIYNVTFSGGDFATNIQSAEVSADQNVKIDYRVVQLPSEDAVLSIAPLDAEKPEGNSGETPFTFTVTRIGDTSGSASVQYAVTGSGTNPADADDFVGGNLPSGTVNFPAGSNSETSTILVAGDTLVEPDETFTVTLSNPNGATIGVGTAIGTIQNDDGAGITVTPTSGLVTTESGGSDTFTVVLTSQPTANVTISLSSSNTTEGTVSPTSLVFTAANWNIAQTVTVTGVDDFIADGDVAYTIVTAPAVSDDPNYDGFDTTDVSVTNVADGLRGWQNPIDRFDVDGDSLVSPFDVLLIINDLNRSGARALEPATAGNGPPPYLDVDGDGFVSPFDALLVINGLNSAPIQPEGEGESLVVTTSADRFAPSMAAPNDLRFSNRAAGGGFGIAPIDARTELRQRGLMSHPDRRAAEIDQVLRNAGLRGSNEKDSAELLFSSRWSFSRSMSWSETVYEELLSDDVEQILAEIGADVASAAKRR